MFESQIGFMASLGFARMPARQVVLCLKELGYNAVEWTFAHFHPRSKSPQELQEIVEMTCSAGLDVSEVVIQQDYVCLDDGRRDDRIRLTIEAINACSDVGVKVVNLFTGPAPWDPGAPRIPQHISEGTAWQMVADAFGRIVPVLANKRVIGAVEGVWGHLCHDYYTTRILVDHFNSPFLGVNLDPSHDVLSGIVDSGWVVRQWGKGKIKHVHLKDAAGTPQPGKFLFPMIGEGNVDWKGMFSSLNDMNYDGFLSVEFESFAYHNQVLKGDTREAARRSLADVRTLLQLAGGGRQ